MKNILVFLIVALLVFGLLPLQGFATLQDRPINVRVKTVDGENSFGYDSRPYNLGYYIDIQWDKPDFTETEGYYQVFYKADGETYEQYGEPLDMNETEIRLSKLDSGTVYHVYVKAYHTHSDDEDDPYRNQTHDSIESDPIYFVTGLEPEAETVSSTEIDVIWQDVKFFGERIAYKLYVSEDENFTNAEPIDIETEDINSGRVTEYGSNHLKYTVGGLKAATTYYIKIRPVIKNLQVVTYPDEKVITSYTYIPATIEKYSQSDTYDIWRMRWNSITSSIGGSESIQYVIMRGEEGGLWKSIGGQTDIVRYIKEYKEDDNKYYYKVRVYIDKYDEYGDQLYIESNEVNTYSYETPYTPPIPEFLDSVDENEDEEVDITQDSIEIIWDAVEKDGNIDTNIYYDFWIVDNSQLLDDEDIEPTITGFVPSESNYIFKKTGGILTNNITAYSLVFEDLDPNTIYYIKAVARKRFNVYENEEIVTKDFISDPAIKLVQTESDLSSVPTAPIKPHFRVGSDEEGNLLITDESVAVEWETGWEEYRDEEGDWIPIEEGETVSDDVYKRINTYDSEVKFALGYMELYKDIDYNDLRDADVQITDIENTFSDSYGTIQYEITDLEQNKNYVIWLRAYRDIDVMSEPSEPLIISTKSDYTIPLEKPAVPEFTYSNALEDNSGIELDWDRSNEREDIEYKYYLKWATTDDINDANNPIEISPDYFFTRDTYLIEDLEQTTPYYFWIKVKILTDDQEAESDWSNSLGITTTSYLAPERPTGFGASSVDNDYIVYEWNLVDGLTYYLEISKEEDFKDSTTYSVDGYSEKVENLMSNTFYYARLYAYDEEKELYSKPSYTIEIKTSRSDNEYDSDVPDETEISGPIEEDDYDSTLDLWTRQIVGANSDRYIEKIVNTEDSIFEIDMEEPPSKYGDIDERQLILDYNIIKALNKEKKDLVINTGDTGSFIIRPNVIKLDNNMNQNTKDIDLYINIRNDIKNDDLYSMYISSKMLFELNMTFEFQEVSISYERFNNPLRVEIPYDDAYIYDSADIKGIVKISNEWETFDAQVKTNEDDDSIVTIELSNSGIAGIAVLNNNMRFTDLYNHWASQDINSIFKEFNISSMADETIFKPNNNITKDDLSKFTLDILGEEYDDSNYFEKIYKAGLLSLSGNKYISRQEFSGFLARLYQLKRGKNIAGGYRALEKYEDNEEVLPEYINEMEFLVSRGIFILRNSRLEPSSYTTRAEAVVMIKKILEAVGEM